MMNQTLQKEKQTNIQLRDIAGEAIQNETERPKKKKKDLKINRTTMSYGQFQAVK